MEIMGCPRNTAPRYCRETNRCWNYIHIIAPDPKVWEWKQDVELLVDHVFNQYRNSNKDCCFGPPKKTGGKRCGFYLKM